MVSCALALVRRTYSMLCDLAFSLIHHMIECLLSTF